MSKRTNREFLMLAEVYDRKKHRSGGMYMSEKLDGMRCVWLPQTRGVPVTDIPFANRDKDTRKHIATGLWSRYGKVIHCPEFFTMGFPSYPLDGELYLNRGGFQKLMSTVKKLEPVDDDWMEVQYLIFDAPPWQVIMQDGRINNPQWSKTIKLSEIVFALKLNEENTPAWTFDATYKKLQRDLVPTQFLRLHEQRLLPFSTDKAIEIIDNELDRVTGLGGEGLVLRNPDSFWEPIRSKYVLKVKALNDAEGFVIGYRAGQGKYEGMLGSLQIRFEDKVFELSGFTDEERTLTEPYREAARTDPGALLPDLGAPVSMSFPIRSLVTFRYRELSDDGIPKEARYWRKAL